MNGYGVNGLIGLDPIREREREVQGKEAAWAASSGRRWRRLAGQVGGTAPPPLVQVEEGRGIGFGCDLVGMVMKKMMFMEEEGIVV